MRVHLLAKNTVEKYISSNIQSRSTFNTWLASIRDADWDTPQDILSTFNGADILGKGSKRVVFNIGGNNYRVICRYHFGKNKVRLYVKWIGSHPAYTKLCKSGKQYIVSDY